MDALDEDEDGCNCNAWQKNNDNDDRHEEEEKDECGGVVAAVTFLVVAITTGHCADALDRFSDDDGGVWRRISNEEQKRPPARQAHSMSTCGDGMIIFGGYGGQHDNDFFSDTWFFSRSLEQWIDLFPRSDRVQSSKLQPPRSASHSMVTASEKMTSNSEIECSMIIFGGVDRGRARVV